MSEIVVEKFDNVLFDPNATRLELVPEAAVNQAIEECRRLVRKAALLAHPECDDAIVDITGMARRPGFCHVDVNVRMVPPPKVHLNVKITSSQEEGLKLSSMTPWPCVPTSDTCSTKGYKL